MMGSGGMIVMDEDTCMVDVAKFFVTFTQSESCGKCTPCREGTKRLLEILTRITEGNGVPLDIEKLEKLGKQVKRASLCGLGQSAPNAILSTLANFRDEYDAHINDKHCPAGAVHGPVELLHRPRQVRRLHPLRQDLPGQVHLRQAQGNPRDRPGHLHQVRRVQEEVPGEGDISGVSGRSLNRRDAEPEGDAEIHGRALY